MELKPIENAIVIHPHVLQSFMKNNKDFANLLALYAFYLYHAQLQKTNQPLVTDEFTRRGMNWAIDRVKRIKKLLKEMKLIEVVQKQKYYYVHLFFIYTKKKIDKILGKSTTSEEVEKEEQVEKKKKKEELPSEKIEEMRKADAQVKPKEKEETKPKKAIPDNPNMLQIWLDYCDKKKIKYCKNNLNYWEKKLNKGLLIEQQEAVYQAINRGWKDFYLVPVKESGYRQFLGKSLMLEKDCDTLLDIVHINKKYIYQFKNIRISTTVPPNQLFHKYGYDKREEKSAPITSRVQDTIRSLVNRF